MEQTNSNFQHEISCQPDYAFLTVQIPVNKTLKVEAGSMSTMSTNLKMTTHMKGGFKRILTGESLFINEFCAEGIPGEIGIAPGVPGDIKHVNLGENDVIYLLKNGFLASSTTITTDSKWQGFIKGLFGANLFLIKCSGTGDLWFNSYGSIVEIDVEDEYTVDTGHIVAFTGTLEYKVSLVGGLKSTFLSGEGLVCKFTGNGKVWIQTRNPNAFGAWIYPFRPVAKD